MVIITKINQKIKIDFIKMKIKKNKQISQSQAPITSTNALKE